MPKNCQFTPYWPYIKYMLKIEVTTYPKPQSMHGIEVQYSWKIETKCQCPCTSPFYPQTRSDMGATHCPSQPMILRPILEILRAPSQMEYTIRHMVVFNSKAYANI